MEICPVLKDQRREYIYIRFEMIMQKQSEILLEEKTGTNL